MNRKFNRLSSTFAGRFLILEEVTPFLLILKGFKVSKNILIEKISNAMFSSDSF